MSSTPTPTPGADAAAAAETNRGTSGLVLALHLIATALVQSTSGAIIFILPVIARKQFGANDWQTLLITAAPTVLFSLSIFWNDLSSRMRMSRYLLLYWAIACLPLGFVALTHGYWWMLACHLVACVGGAAYPPVQGELLRAFYPAERRGRIYSILWGTMMAIGAGMGFGVGKLLTWNAESFRVYMPVGVGLQLTGVLMLIGLSACTGHSRRRTLLKDDQTLYQRVIEPVTHMREVLKNDQTFFRYEAAYMTYGVGWMIAYALLPILVTTKLGLNYEEIAKSTHVVYLLALVAMLFPAGWLMDRMGALKSTAISFALLTLYPIGLLLSDNDQHLTLASVVFGIAHAGASVGWMLGPVSLAPSPEKVPQYVAIHATMVGIRGKVFQFLGVGLYMLTHSFTLPLVIAAAAYAWSAVQMWQLHTKVPHEKRSM